jgi:Fe-S cluster assembly iron-binding protein IscA
MCSLPFVKVITADLKASQQLVKIASREPGWNPEQPHLALRLSVESGGCHGYQYDMKLVEEQPNIDD